MSKLTLCGWASCDENYNVTGGKPGDQRNGEEVKCGDWNYFGQTEIYRWKDRELAKKYADILKALCLNDHIGYNQARRWTLNDILRVLKWDYTKLTTDCECDCSALVGCAINCLFKEDKVSMGIQTGSMRLYLPLEYFDILTGDEYCNNDKNLKIGDIINRPYKHVITALEDSNGEIPLPVSIDAKLVDDQAVFYEGDTLTARDFLIKVKFSDGSVQTNPQEWTANPLTLTEGENVITVKYYSCETKIFVKALSNKKMIYRVQVGAYILKEYAENMLASIEKDGFPGYIIEKDGIYRVQVGAYYNKMLADTCKDALVICGYHDAFIAESYE